MAEPLSRAAVLDATLGELAGYWLGIQCGGCGSLVYYPCKLMGRERGAGLRVREVLPRLRCRPCRDKPSRVLVFLTDDPTGGASGGKAWKVGLSP
jgi:hypothetical protein